MTSICPKPLAIGKDLALDSRVPEGRDRSDPLRL
jgi:hypothetical protein